MKMTQVIMMTLRKVRRIRNVLQVQEGSGWILYNLRPYVLYIFGKIMQIPVQWYDPSDQDHHQEDQNDQECPPSSRRFLMAIGARAEARVGSGKV